MTYLKSCSVTISGVYYPVSIPIGQLAWITRCEPVKCFRKAQEELLWVTLTFILITMSFSIIVLYPKSTFLQKCDYNFFCPLTDQHYYSFLFFDF